MFAWHYALWANAWEKKGYKEKEINEDVTISEKMCAGKKEKITNLIGS